MAAAESCGECGGRRCGTPPDRRALAALRLILRLPD
tara:strand:- start:38 stop:145 length:108 start_codon:yes stop_codon:yes gene_type:complete